MLDGKLRAGQSKSNILLFGDRHRRNGQTSSSKPLFSRNAGFCVVTKDRTYPKILTSLNHHIRPFPLPISVSWHPLVAGSSSLLAGRRRVRPRRGPLVRPLAGPSLGRGRTICARAPSASPRTCPSSQRCPKPHLPSARRLPRPSDATDASPPSDRRQRVTDDVVGDTADAAIAFRCAAPR